MTHSKNVSEQEVTSLAGPTLRRGFCTLTLDLGLGYGGVSYILSLQPQLLHPQAKLQWKKCADMPVGMSSVQADVMEEKCSH